MPSQCGLNSQPHSPWFCGCGPSLFLGTEIEGGVLTCLVTDALMSRPTPAAPAQACFFREDASLDLDVGCPRPIFFRSLDEPTNITRLWLAYPLQCRGY
jgi:hypothetical protein